MNDIHEVTCLALLGHVPFLPIEDADGAYVVFMELLNHPVPPKNVAIIMGGGSKVESLCDKSAVAEGRKQSIPNSSRHIEWRVAYKTTTLPCSSLNRDGTLFST